MGNWGDWIGVFLIVAVLFGWGNFGGAGGESVQYAIDNQTTQQGIRDILLSSANNNYETAQLISAQTRDYMASNYTNQLAVINGFNAIQSTLDGISSKIGTCCCDIKSTLLQDKYDAALRELAKAETKSAVADGNAYMLSVMGKWIANPSAT